MPSPDRPPIHLVVVGLSHQTAPVEVRDRVVFSAQTLERALRELKCLERVQECAVLSTCNRSEIYVATPDGEGARGTLTDFFSHFHQIARDQIEPHLFAFQNEEAIRHLFAVACGLESMIVGEPQIAGQVKDAHAHAMSQGATGALLNRLFQSATEVSKRARTETQIGAGAVSVSFAAVELAKSIFGRLDGRAALVFGAGEMSELTARYLIDSGIQSITVASRTYERAAELAERIGGRAVSFQEGLDVIAQADIVLSSTGAPRYIIHKEAVVAAMKRRKNAPIFFIDIAVPRDVEPEVGDLYNVFLYNIDDLQSVVAANLKKRDAEAEKVRAILQEEVSAFLTWWGSLDLVPTIVSLRERFQRIGEQEMERWNAKLAGLSDEQRAVVVGLLRGYMNKLLHDPIARLKASSETGDGLANVSALRYLFDLDKYTDSR